MSYSFIALRRFARLQLAAGAIVTLASCSGTSDAVAGPDGVVADHSLFSSRTVATVSVTPLASTLTIGQTLQLAAAALNYSGAVVTGNIPSWSSSNKSVITVSSTGLVKPVAPGTATVSATISGRTGKATLIVTGAPAVGAITNLAVASTNDTSAVVTFTAVGDATGTATMVDIRYATVPFTWATATSAKITSATCASSKPSAPVGSTITCNIGGLKPATTYDFQLVAYTGTLNLNAVFGALSNIAAATTTSTAQIVVATVASVVVSPSTSNGTIGVKLPLTVTVRDKSNNLMTGKPVTWKSSNTGIATVDTLGTTMGMAAGTATFTATVAGVSGTAAVTESAAAVVPPQAPAGSQGGLYPNQPAGYSRIAETDMSAMPSKTSMIAGKAAVLATPASLETIVSGSVLPSTFPDATAHFLKHVIEAGTAAGYAEASNHYAQFDMWALGEQTSANGGPSDVEYSAFYQSTYFSVYGNGTTIETPPPGIKALGYWGVTNNNQNSSGSGPTQIYAMFTPVSPSGTSPLTTSQFSIDMITQNGSNIRFSQNLNTSKHVVVGQVHHFEQVLTLGTAGSANGTWDWWLDGVQIGHYTNVPYINSAYASKGGNGLSGFWGWQFSPYWGGSGGANKTRDDAIYVGYTYISGIFLRNPM